MNSCLPPHICEEFAELRDTRIPHTDASVGDILNLIGDIEELKPLLERKITHLTTVGDVLDAIVALEREGKAQDSRTASYSTAPEQNGPVSPEMAQAQSEYHEQSKKSRFGEVWGRFCAQVKAVLRAGIDMTFIVDRNGDRVLSMPVIFVVIGLLAWGASLWLLVIGLFLGFRYRIEGASPVTVDVNDVMDKAANVADGIRKDFKNDNE